MQRIFAPSLTETKTCLFQLRRLIENMNEDVITWTLSLARSLTHSPQRSSGPFVIVAEERDRRSLWWSNTPRRSCMETIAFFLCFSMPRSSLRPPHLRTSSQT